jgi:hypothetical protein
VRTLTILLLTTLAPSLCGQDEPPPTPPVPRVPKPVAGEGAEPDAGPIDELLARMRIRERERTAVSYRLELRIQLMSTLEPTVCKGTMRAKNLSTEHERVATSMSWETQIGEVLIECVRNAEGVFLHERSPLHPEAYLRLDAATASQLRTPKGRDPFGVPEPTAFGGSHLIAGWLDGFTFDLGREPEALGETKCWRLVGRRQSSAQEVLVQPQAKMPAATGLSMAMVPDVVEIWVGADDLLVRHLEERRGEQVLRRVVIDQVVCDGEIEEAMFRLELPAGAKWEPMLEDAVRGPELQKLLAGDAGKAVPKASGKR